MPKFNRPVPPPVHDTTTAQGGPGFSRDPKTELFLLGLANTVGEETFYETGESRDKRFADLVAEITRADPEWVRRYGAWLRAEGFMRSAPLVLAAEYVAAGGPNGREIVDAVLQRPDEPAELLSYWLSAHGRKIPMAVKRGVADAVRRLYTERNLLRYDGTDKPMRWGDVIDIVHPKPSATWQSDLFRYALDRRHNRSNPRLAESLTTVTADRALMALPSSERRTSLSFAVEAGWSWERLAGWLPGGMTAEAWEAIIPNMGLMALARNLRNFDEAGVSDVVAAQITARFADPDEVARSRQFPIRFLTAWKAVASLRWGLALEAALNLSVANIPALPGRTLVLVDVSPSMTDQLLSRSASRTPTVVRPFRWEAAAVFGFALALRAEHADVGLFDFGYDRFEVTKGASILRLAEQVRDRVVRGNGTDTLGALLRGYAGHDRVVILTDEQTGRGAPFYHGHTSLAGYGYVGDPAAWENVMTKIKVPVTTFNLAGYETGHTPEFRNWSTIGGISDACFKLLGAVERRARDRWPWDEPARVSAP